MGSSQRKAVQCVVALDFGTTYSGYAFSTVENFRKDKLNISLNQAWNAGVAQLISYKTPTTLLLSKSGEFISYGYEAEREYEDILLDEKKKNSDYMYFRRFKMELYFKQAHASMVLMDECGNEYQALEVFSKSIKALRDHCIGTIKAHKGDMYHDDEIKWAITVPAIWSDEAKMFMRKACQNADIPAHRLVMALEPEVASIYCQLSSKDVLRPRSRYLVVDLGGGTVDLSGYEILRNGCFKQICSATGKDCGGTSVDQEFFKVLTNILGEENMQIFKTNHTSEFLQLCSDFESAKRNISNNQRSVNIRIPDTTLNDLVPGENFEKMILNSEYADKLSVKKGKLRLDPEFTKSLFTKTIDTILSTMKDTLQKADGSNMSVILLVGGLSESKIVQDKVKLAFPRKDVIIPDDPTVAVLKGAVVYGHRPDVVTTRITQYYYGRKIKPLFKPEVHDSRRKTVIDGETRCDGVFELLVPKGTAVPIGKKVSRSYHTISRTQEYIRVSIYKTVDDKTKYIDEAGCTLVGECSIPVLASSDRRREIIVNFEFGDTEIIITGSGRDAGQITKDTFLLV